jgi:ribose transport system ATP-binding protein
VVLQNIAHATHLGIALVHQELMLANNLDIAANIFLGSEPAKFGMLDTAAMHRESRKWLDRVGLHIPTRTPAGLLTAGQMQMVEIAKALSHKARILILDEPTSSLSHSESEQLFRIIAELKTQGVSIIYISHRMEEVQRLADSVTVLRDGKNVGDMTRAEATQEKIVSMMVGRQLNNWYPPRRNFTSEKLILKVENLHVVGTPAPVSFDVREGEILGFAGLVGAGRTELVETIFGVTPPLSGSIELDGRRFSPATPRDAIKRGIYLAPEDRKRHGLILGMSVAKNMSLPDIGNYRPRWLLRSSIEQRVAKDQIDRLKIKTPSTRQWVGMLSGGTQQKVVLGKWLAMKPKVLMLDEPTRGVDVGAKAEIYRQIRELADAGITIIFVSSEMEEILGMADRVVIMRDRRIAGIFPRDKVSQEVIAAKMIGE